MVNLPQDSSVDVRILKQMLTESLAASYKLFWFSGIFEEIKNGNQKIPFRRIVCRMIASAWYPSLEYHLNFGANDKLYDTVIFIHKKYGIESNIQQNELLQFLEEINDNEVEKKISNFYNLVPYRLLAPFFKKDLLGMKDTKRNKRIVELSKLRKDVFYQIDDINRTISINDEWYYYINKNNPIVYGWMNYEIINYLQKRNPNVPAIPFKFAPPHQRNLNAAKKFWQEVNTQIQLYDIYTSKPLIAEYYTEHGEFSIDHFIPWSFVLHDELWNLVPTFKNINSSKSNKLPDLELYIDKFCDLQYCAFSVMRKNRAFQKDLQDYLTINKKIDITYSKHRNVPREQFVDSIKSTIKPLFQIAYNQGYDLWHTDDVSKESIIIPSYTVGQSFNT